MLFKYISTACDKYKINKERITYINKSMILTSNKNVDIKFSAHDAFLELPSSGTLKVKIFERQII